MTANIKESVSIAADLLTGFPAALRAAGLMVDPGRAKAFLRAVTICRLSGPADLSRIGRVTLTGSPEDFPVFDAVFENFFGEATVSGRVNDPEDDRAPRPAHPRGEQALTRILDGEAAGQDASEDELRNRKIFSRLASDDREALARLGRRLDDMPKVLRRNWTASSRGTRINLAGTTRAARRTFGETLCLTREDRPEKPRRLLFLIDVSGSMKIQSELTLRFAQLATRRLPKVETFCFGTRLSRVTSILKHRSADVALERLSDIVSDFDGGTLIGTSLDAFLSVSRHAALVRGAVTVIFSDGLERGDPALMIHSVGRLARLSHRLIWATPLAADPRYRPATRGMAGVLPLLDALCDGSSLAALDRMIVGLETTERMGRGQAGHRFQNGRIAA
ncbi:vWA domain-containing protein [Mesorhizobium sp. ZC-5]|uniref:vWA domain-containing protein n=1 Tax=Mesorhizobium sp. ZC-5 TaxID=2986066 RepID=UPI0021E73225|nr:VWA domain-containing protein [Mesorhizobium sp. ZC-5]MCV3239366.1 VWA domain-containing protein [Mesorhizobium sp. ZC-5]